MNDQAIILIALYEAAFVIADHLEPGLPRDPLATVKRLIKVLDGQDLVTAINRAEQGSGLKVVK